jgi:hypothetical protein
MSVWNPEPHDPWYVEEEEEQVPAWQKIVCDALLVLILFAFIAFFGFTLGYFNVFKS